MRVWYLRAPSKLILSSSTSCISVLKLSSSTSIQVSADASATQVKAGVYADVVRGASPYDVMYQDQTVTSVSGSGLYFVNFTGSAFSTSDFVDRTTISNERSDYICLRGTSPYAQIPDELFPFLCAAAVSRRVLEAIGDREGASVMQNTLDARRREALSLIIPRNEDGSKPIVKKFSPPLEPRHGPEVAMTTVLSATAACPILLHVCVRGDAGTLIACSCKAGDHRSVGPLDERGHDRGDRRGAGRWRGPGRFVGVDAVRQVVRGR